MRKICVYPHTDKPEAVVASERACALLCRAGIEAEIYSCGARTDAQAVIALGGDGTFLRAQRFAAPLGLPVLCVNLGRLGFLSEVEADELDAAVQRIVCGDYVVDARMMLSCERQGREEIALNDIVVHRGTSQRMIRFDVFVNGELMDSCAADGTVVASPTGSTAYALSAGGPVVSPGMECMLVVAICPHTLRARPVMIPADASVRVHITSAHGDALVSTDGQRHDPLREGECVTVTRAKTEARFIRLHPSGFYGRLRTKLLEWSS